MGNLESTDNEHVVSEDQFSLNKYKNDEQVVVTSQDSLKSKDNKQEGVTFKD